MRKVADDGAYALYALDSPELGPNHLYRCETKDEDDDLVVHFQEGPVQEVGVNGVPDILLAYMLRDRMAYFRKNYPCAFNVKALKAINKFIDALNERTADRKKRGVEGTSAD